MSGQEQDKDLQASPFAAKLCDELKRRGWTNQRAAQELGVSERQITRWKGGQEPRYESVVNWARVFERTVESFYAVEQVAA